MKKILNGLMNIIRDVLDQIWTLVGLAIGWLVLEGSAKTTTANLVIGALIIWIVTHRIRNPKE